MADLEPQTTDHKDHHPTAGTDCSVAVIQEPFESAAAYGKLPSLPAEVIFSICSHFTVEPHNPAKSFNISRDTKDNIRALRNLSLTCRSIHHEVTPALYSCIYFTGPTIDPELPIPTHFQHPGADSLVYFLRTMVDNASLRQHVKHLACLINLRDHYYFTKQNDIPYKDCGILSAIQNCEDIRTMHLLEWAGLWMGPSSEPQRNFETAFGAASRRPIISLSHQIFAMIACLLPNVISITLKAGSHWTRYPEQADLYDINAEDIDRHTRCNMHPLQSLTMVQVQYEPEHFDVEACRDRINLLRLMPILQNASNLTHIRCHGSILALEDLPDAVASLKCRGPLSGPILCTIQGNQKPQHLKHVVVHLDCVTMGLDFDLDCFCRVLCQDVPQLEQLELLLSPGTCINDTTLSIMVKLQDFTRLRHFTFDTRFISDSQWANHFWRYESSLFWGPELRCIEKLSLVDTEPRFNCDSILEWLQLLTRAPAQGESRSRLRSIDFLHIPFLAEVNDKSSLRSTSNLANELKQELALNDVDFQLFFMNDKNGDFSRAEFPEDRNMPRQTNDNTDD